MPRYERCNTWCAEYLENGTPTKTQIVSKIKDILKNI